LLNGISSSLLGEPGSESHGWVSNAALVSLSSTQSTRHGAFLIEEFISMTI
jgi:hypothetical protein